MTMNTKLTLNIDNGIIQEAKLYAKRNRISVSKLIENYLHSTQIQQQASLLLLEFGKECLQKEVKATFI